MSVRDPYPGKLPCVCGAWLESAKLTDLLCPLCLTPLVFSCTLRGIARAEDEATDLRSELAHLANTARVERLPETAERAHEIQRALAKLIEDMRTLRDTVRDTAAKKGKAA